MFLQAAGLLHPELRELELNHCRVGQIGSLASAPALQRLELRDNGLTAIEGLEALSGLKSLDLQGNRIDKIGDALALCSSLTYVDLSYNALSFKKPEALSAEYLPNLKELFLAENRIKTARGLAAVSTSLTQLDIGSNKLKVVAPELGYEPDPSALVVGSICCPPPAVTTRIRSDRLGPSCLYPYPLLNLFWADCWLAMPLQLQAAGQPATSFPRSKSDRSITGRDSTSAKSSGALCAVQSIDLVQWIGRDAVRPSE